MYKRRGRPATEEERQLAASALRDLAQSALRVTLVPAPEPHFDGHKIRAVEDRNPNWYRAFARWTKAGCQTKRSRIRLALLRVYNGYVRPNGYEVQLLRVLG